MEIMPSDYGHISLSREEKIFVRHVQACEDYGFLLLDTNPAMLESESMHILMTQSGVLILKFFNDVTETSSFGKVMSAYKDFVYPKIAQIIAGKLTSNQVLVDTEGKLRFPINLIWAFPGISVSDINVESDQALSNFVREHCVFKGDLQKVRNGLDEFQKQFLSISIAALSSETMAIDDQNINSILQRIAPQYVIIRVGKVKDESTTAGAKEELLVVTKEDRAAKAFRLDAEQINIVNKIQKGEQLILACAGSGKSVLLISKCFKAAQMNPDKKFLLTCYNNKLRSMYTQFLDWAGFHQSNVECMTFHRLCRVLLEKSGFPVLKNDYDAWASSAIDRLNKGQIKERFYGIFIDEVQQFKPEWYKFCFNLLENKEFNDHLFVICGDKTQKLANLQRHGRAPWNVGEGYPTYRGNRCIRIERNYRNCIEINEFINCFVANAKQFLTTAGDSEFDPDMFLRGRSVFHGPGVELKRIESKSTRAESQTICDSIEEIHSTGVPYDEIAVIMYNTKYKAKIAGWRGKYTLYSTLTAQLSSKHIPYTTMFTVGDEGGAGYAEGDGVRLITVQSVLGLDFRAAIVCGLLSLGEHDQTKRFCKDQYDEEVLQEKLENIRQNIQNLYVACTRAKEILHVVIPEAADESIYMKMLENAN